MPLSAVDRDGRTYVTWAMPEERWHWLRKHYRDLRLQARCCGAEVIPARSHLGTMFFRHRSKPCASGGEGAEHLACKSIIASAAAGLGFDVATEVCGPERAWIADVMVSTSRWRVSIEVQLSRISLDQIERRTKRYTHDRVRVAWLLGYNLAHDPSRDLPMFRLRGASANPLQARVCPCESRQPQTALTDFVDLLLTGKVRFVEAPSARGEPVIVSAPWSCWKCLQPLSAIVGFANVAGHPVLAPHGFLAAGDVTKVPEVFTNFRKAIPALIAANPNFALIRRTHFGDASSPMRLWCPHCNAPLSLHRLPSELFVPDRQQRWTLDGRLWSATESRRPGWTW